MKKANVKFNKKSLPQVATAVETLTLVDVKDAVATDALNYEMTNQRIKILESYMKDSLRPNIEKIVERFGIPDPTGHKHLELDGVEVIHERRTTAGFNSVAAEEILKKKGLLESVAQRVVIERWELDEEKIMDAYEAELITPEELDQMFNEKVSWALKVKVDKDKNPEYDTLCQLRKSKPKQSQDDMPTVES